MPDTICMCKLNIEIDTDSDGMVCACTEEISSPESTLIPDCRCPTGQLDLVIHEESCLLYNHERFTIPHDVVTCECQTPRFQSGNCKCCACPENMCRCKKAGREAFDEWRKNRKSTGPMLEVLEVSHPLMQKFQETLTRFLEKENTLAQNKILQLRYDLKMSKEAYDKELEAIYHGDHDTNSQRALILEYESIVEKMMAERAEEEKMARKCAETLKKAQDKLDQDIMTEKDALIELETVSQLSGQIEKWQEEIKTEKMTNLAMSDNMNREKRCLAAEKRELDIIIFNVSSEIWKFQTKLEMYQAQYDVKTVEMNDMNDKVSLYAAELDDLELDKRRLISLWNSVLVNIKQRNLVYDSVQNDYNTLRVNYRTLASNIEVTKKEVTEEVYKGKRIAMVKEKLEYDLESLTKQYDLESGKDIVVQNDIREMTEAIEMLEKDQELIKVENLRLTKNMSSLVKEVDKKVAKSVMLENEILSNFEGLLLNTKAVESMVNGIKKMRDIGRKQEIALAATEMQHEKLMLELEIHRARQTINKKTLQDTMDKVVAMEEELVSLEQLYEKNILIIRRKQRDFEILNKRYNILRESLDNKSPEEVRFDALEQQINELRKRTEELQQQWLRLQGHVVLLTQRHQSLVTDIHLINTQIQVCDHKLLRIQLDRKKILAEKSRVECSLHDLRVRWELIQGGKKKAIERNEMQTRDTVNRTHEFSANLKDAECELLEMEEEIETNENKIQEMNQYLDRLQREAMIWQRKGILAVELKNNLKNAQSASGDIGKMKTEIARMEIRRHHLLQMSENMATELARCVTKRETAMDKNRSDAAVAEKQKEKGLTMKTQYHHKLRLAKADVARVTKDIVDSKVNIETLEKEEAHLEEESAELKILNTQLEENIVQLLQECVEADIERQWLLQRIIRSQHLGIDLAKVVKRKSLKTRSKINCLSDFIKAFALNDRLMYTLEALDGEFPYLKDKMATIVNTLDIHSPTNSPRIIEDNVEEVLRFANMNLAEPLIVCGTNDSDDSD